MCIRDSAAPDQFRVIPGRAALHTQASTTNNPLLSELAPTNTLWIHTERAQALGIADGDWVEVCTATGPVGRLRAKVTTGIHPEAVFMPVSYTHLDVYKRQLIYLKGAMEPAH